MIGESDRDVSIIATQFFYIRPIFVRKRLCVCSLSTHPLAYYQWFPEMKITMNTKTILAASLAAVFAVSMIFLTTSLPAEAGKPQEVVEWSNGYPSGEHFNLNIHGKKDGFVCDSTSGGGSVFVPEYGDAEIQYIQNKRSNLAELYVIDPCSFGPNDPAKVQLPTGEYQVYARILAKPAKIDEDRSVIFYPKLIEACNDTGADTFPDAVDCSDSFLIGTGVITKDGVFDNNNGEELERIVPVKGNNKAVEITDMFQWTGFACDQIFDTNMDGEITVDDVPADLTGDEIIDGADLAIYLATNCTLFESQWIFDIADLVVYGWDYKNNGAKLVQVRFYPVDTTEFIQ